MFQFFKSFYLTGKYQREVLECLDHIYDEYFPGIERGQSLLDGMSADLALFIYGDVVRREGDRLFVKISYSIKEKACIAALGTFHCIYENGVVSEITRKDG
ncbi:hypothetical protein [Gimesia fumaroli]|uniref:SnoaL-like domain-containing protein n=1 Tax=Gimesia fumaroli TaxID=2527976 RepID=A0A518ICS6_9PLAN|nr:hypothetical protein [Gimesia fumaroli]QDV50908.1 hypothetical protein Enr17x_29530 [Gimesia fumaroli]